MQPGRLRYWLTFETKVTEQDSDGAQVESWVPAFDPNPRMPCEVVFLSGRELLASQAVSSKVNARIKVRFREGFNAMLRATTTAGQIFNIEAVIPDPETGRRFVTLLASTGVNEG